MFLQSAGSLKEAGTLVVGAAAQEPAESTILQEADSSIWIYDSGLCYAMPAVCILCIFTWKVFIAERASEGGGCSTHVVASSMV